MRLDLLFAFGELVDFVGEDVFGEGESDGMVEASQQLCKRLVLAPDEHCDRRMFLSGHGYAADGVDDADGNFAIFHEASEIRQEVRDRVADGGWFRTLLQAAG